MTGRSRTRIWGALVTVIALGATLEPLRRKPYEDGFPLSTYPMFATPRPTRFTLAYAVVIGADGKRSFVPPRYVSGGEVLQAGAMINRTIMAPRGEQQALCNRIATRIAAGGRWPGFQAIAVVSGTHDSIDFLVEDARGPEHEEYRCPAPGAAPR